MGQAPARVRVNVLGPFELRGVPAALERAPALAPSGIAMLAYLAMAAGSVRRETLRGLFFPSLIEEEAWLAINRAVFDLRRSIGEDAIVLGGGGEVTLDRSLVDCDAVEFEERCRTGDLADAMSLYRGEFLWDVYVSEPRQLDEWITLTRARLRAKAGSACTTLSMDVADRDARAALDWSRRAYEIEQSETSLRRLMVLHDALGDTSGAIRQYEKFARALRAERNIEPAPETQRLFAEIWEGQRAEIGEPRLLAPASSANPRGKAMAVLATTAAIVIIGVALVLLRGTGGIAQSNSSRGEFHQGEADFHAGRYEQAVAHFKRATLLDTTNALGFFRLSEAANWTNESGLANESAARALRLSAGLTAPEQTRIMAWADYLNGRADSAQRLYSAMIAVDSGDADAWFYLAEIRFHWGPILGSASIRSAPAWDRVLELDPKNAGALLHRLRIAAMEFDRAKFDELATRLDKLEPSSDRAVEVRALRAFAFEDSTAQAAATTAIEALDNLKKSLVREMLVGTHDLRRSGRMLVPILFLGHGFSSIEQGDFLLLAQTEAATGDLTRALAIIDSAAMLQPDRALEYKAMLASMEDLPGATALRGSVRRELQSKPSPTSQYSTVLPLRRYLSATLAVRDGDLPAARASLAELRALSPKLSSSRDSTVSRHVDRLSRLVAAEIDRADGRAADALNALGAPALEPDMRIPYVWSYPRAHERFLRGELAAELGRLEEADAWFATFPDPGAYDLPYLPWALRRRALVADQRKDTAMAAVLRARANELWPRK
jgi:DNA-binding SARP family transcriptional activator